MTTVHLVCLMHQCGWEPVRGSPPREQLIAYRAHWAARHPHPRSREDMASRTEIKKLNELLDSYIEKALTWPVRGDESGPFDNDGLAAEMEDKVAKTAATAAGRGVAEALAICGQEGIAGPEDTDGKNATALIRLAVAKFRNGGVEPEISKPEPVAEEPVAASAADSVAAAASAADSVAAAASAAEAYAPTVTADGMVTVDALGATHVGIDPATVTYGSANGSSEDFPASVDTVAGLEPGEFPVDPEPVAEQPAAPIEPHVLRESYESWVNTSMRPGAGAHVQAGGDPCPSCGGRGYTHIADPADTSGSSLGFSSPCITCGRLGYIAALPDPATQYVELDAEHIASIRAALDGGFDAPTLAAQFKIPLEQVESLR